MRVVKARKCSQLSPEVFDSQLRNRLYMDGSLLVRSFAAVVFKPHAVFVMELVQS